LVEAAAESALDAGELLELRTDLAGVTGSRNPAKTVRQLERLVTEAERSLGPNHPDTLTARYQIAYFTGEAGRHYEALALYRALLADQERSLGPDHPNTLTARYQIAYFTGVTGHRAEAVALLRALLADRVRILGPNHPHTLATRWNIDSLTRGPGWRARVLP
jgi:hypothetical protein